MSERKIGCMYERDNEDLVVTYFDKVQYFDDDKEIKGHYLGEDFDIWVTLVSGIDKKSARETLRDMINETSQNNIYDFTDRW